MSDVIVGKPGEKARILAADDRPEALRLLGKKYECEFATSAAMAREKLAGLPFELALCSMQMPEESEPALVDEIARNHPDTAIVTVTDADDLDAAEHAFRLGVRGYLVKPFRSGQLLITVANALRQHRLELAVQETAERLAGAIEIHDPETGRHVKRMASIAAMLGTKLGLDANRVQLLRAAAPMHDIGKIATPDGVLHKREELTPSERERMEAHTTVGHRVLVDSESELLKMAAKIALTHHEWFDGSGYPQGLSGGRIPLEGRIVAVADVFDALLSDRPYQPAVTTEEAAKLIASGRCVHFDPNVVDALLDNIDEALALRD
jgi:putative two-component system response regulator